MLGIKKRINVNTYHLGMRYFLNGGFSFLAIKSLTRVESK